MWVCGDVEFHVQDFGVVSYPLLQLYVTFVRWKRYLRKKIRLFSFKIFMEKITLISDCIIEHVEWFNFGVS